LGSGIGKGKASRPPGSPGTREASSAGWSRFWSKPLNKWVYSAVLIVLTVAVYWPAHGHPFSINDDEQYVVNNSHLRGDLGWETVRWAFATHDLANWHPLTWLSHAADFQMFQLNPAGHHDMNLLFHVLNAVLLFLVLRRATGFSGRSFMVAAIFALHPVNVETVAWIAERKNLLSMLFFLLALGAYHWYTSRPRIGPYVLVAFLYALGLLAKPQIVTFPFVLLLWDYWPLRRIALGRSKASDTADAIPAQSLSFLVLEKLPFLLLSFGSASAESGWGAAVLSAELSAGECDGLLRSLSRQGTLAASADSLLSAFAHRPMAGRNFYVPASGDYRVCPLST
jgi:hypothetical protein